MPSPPIGVGMPGRAITCLRHDAAKACHPKLPTIYFAGKSLVNSTAPASQRCSGAASYQPAGSTIPSRAQEAQAVRAAAEAHGIGYATLRRSFREASGVAIREGTVPARWFCWEQLRPLSWRRKRPKAVVASDFRTGFHHGGHGGHGGSKLDRVDLVSDEIRGR